MVSPLREASSQIVIQRLFRDAKRQSAHGVGTQRHASHKMSRTWDLALRCTAIYLSPRWTPPQYRCAVSRSVLRSRRVAIRWLVIHVPLRSRGEVYRRVFCAHAVH